jgi:hypothetical protein
VKRLKRIEVVSPNGAAFGIDASDKGSLALDRQSPNAAFIDIRDDGLPKHGDGFDRLVAQVPTSWALLLRWEE